ncbi:MAG: pyrroloquinoline quinone biosynthesis peptide chaperone PqqD [Acidobacteria bacterium]|nr:pyrroloquinoline quinone biosynthesis peptide chaperone PqqD [Acidobacteriota bacterium]
MELSSVPRMAAGCRVHATQDVLLIPEGTLNLTGSAREILLRVDGEKSVERVVAELLQEYEGVDAREMQADVLGLLRRLEERGVVRA